MMKKFSLLLAAMCLTATPLPAQNNAPSDPFANPQIKAIQARLDKGVAGDAQAVKDLVRDLKEMIKQQPNNQLLVAYLGSAYSLRSRDAWIADKMKYLKEAEATMNKAVAADPDNAAVRFIRATNMYYLPAVFGMKDEARSDFKKLVQQIEGPNQTGFNSTTKQAVYYFAGLSYEQTDDPQEAKRAWQTGIGLDPGSKLATAMKKKLGIADEEKSDAASRSRTNPR